MSIQPLSLSITVVMKCSLFQEIVMKTSNYWKYLPSYCNSVQVTLKLAIGEKVIKNKPLTQINVLH